MNTFKQTAAGLAAMVLVFAACAGLYLGYWWLFEDTTDRRVEVDNRQTGTQTAWQDEAHDQVNDFLLLDPNTPAAGSLRNTACDLIGRLSDPYLDDQLADFQTTEC
ncbi:MAG TPA: hypothetical protein VGW74_10550 [Propionibacteriaceae bacterium]|nr:hypothetical protein [Propionibacteriaceae bacterium]